MADCTFEDLLEEVRKLADEGRFDSLVIESTGILNHCSRNIYLCRQMVYRCPSGRS